MRLSVFNEFGASAEQLTAIEEIVAVDRAAEPMGAAAKADEDLVILRSNAKLFFDPATPAAEVDAVLARLTPLGFEVTIRNPKTSAGFAMTDRVILKFNAAS